MPGQSNVKLPCGRTRYCGRTDCQHAVHCASLREASAGRPKGAPATKAKPLARPADVIYLYDGSLPGLYCCVHESVYTREIPTAIYQQDAAQPTLFRQSVIETDEEKAAKVQASIPAKISARAADLVQATFLSCLAQKELAILRFLLTGYQYGRQTPWMMGHEDVKPVLDAEKHLSHEAHLLTGFIRFSDYDGVLAATITPKNFVLPFLVNHFTGRYAEEEFIIFDKTHKAALLYQNRQSKIVPLEGIDFPEADETEEGYRALWKQFYNTIAIQERINPTCRRTHMPKRYWENMLEVQDLLK